MDLIQREINLLNAEKKITSENLAIQNQKLANSLLNGSLGKDINQTFSKKVLWVSNFPSERAKSLATEGFSVKTNVFIL